MHGILHILKANNNNNNNNTKFNTFPTEIKRIVSHTFSFEKQSGYSTVHSPRNRAHNIPQHNNFLTHVCLFTQTTFTHIEFLIKIVIGVNHCLDHQMSNIKTRCKVFLHRE